MQASFLPNLRPVREKQGLSRMALAEMAGCCEETLKRAEGAYRGKRTSGLTLYNALAIADALDVSLDYLADRGAIVGCDNVKMFLTNYRRPQ